MSKKEKNHHDYNPTCEERWEQGIEGDPVAYEIIDFLSRVVGPYSDYEVDIEMGGDGDEGNTMVLALERFFFDKETDPDYKIRGLQLSEKEPIETGPIEFTTSYGKVVRGYFFAAPTTEEGD